MGITNHLFPAQVAMGADRQVPAACDSTPEPENQPDPAPAYPAFLLPHPRPALPFAPCPRPPPAPPPRLLGLVCVNGGPFNHGLPFHVLEICPDHYGAGVACRKPVN